MGHKTLAQLKTALSAELVKYLTMHKETHEAAIAHLEAEKRKQALYSKEHEQAVKVFALWKELNPNVWKTQGYVKLPDGRMVEIRDNLIFDCEVEAL